MSFDNLFSKYNIPMDENGWHIRKGDIKVLTMDVYKNILGFYINGFDKINILKMEDGNIFKGTDNHKVLVKKDENREKVWKTNQAQCFDAMRVRKEISLLLLLWENSALTLKKELKVGEKTANQGKA